MKLGRWATIFLLLFMAAALLGMMIDAIRWIAGFLFVVCVLVAVASFATKKRT